MTRLSARDLIGRTYGWFLGEFATAMRLVAVPASLHAATVFLTFRIEAGVLGPALSRGPDAVNAVAPWLTALSAFTYALQLLMPAVATGAVLRCILRGERRGGLAFDVGKTELLICAATIVLGVAVFGAAFVGMIVAALAATPIAMASPPLALALAAAAVCVLALYVAARFIALQPLALDRGAVAIDVAWRLSRGEARPVAVALIGVYALPVAGLLLAFGAFVLWLAASPEFVALVRSSEAADPEALRLFLLTHAGELAVPFALVSGLAFLIAVPMGAALAAFAYLGLTQSGTGARAPQGPAFGPPR